MTTDSSKPVADLRVWLADLTHTQHALGADTFPLGVGCIATYAETRFAFPEPIPVFRYPQAMAQALADKGCPDVVGFSNYIWNGRLGLAFARRIKELRPDTIVVMGGPNYPLEAHEQEAFLRRHPEVDFYVVHEGEVAFAQLLADLLAAGMDKEAVVGRTPSVHALDRHGQVRRSEVGAPRLRDLDEIPSPYLTGKFDEFFDGRLWPLLQTKRGCPFTCTFCTEGLDYYSKVARYSLARLEAEVEYIGSRMAEVRAKGGRSDLYIADSNFGMFKEDADVARALARSRALYRWPDHINASTGKNQKQRVLEAVRILDGSIVLSGSVQSLDPTVLENVRRQNISAEDLMALALEANQVGANSYCELILGLPGETRQTHFETIRTIVAAGFNKVLPYQLMILPGSVLGSDSTKRKYRMDLRARVLPRAFGLYEVCGQSLPVADIEEVCVATDTLSFEDYLECRRMHLVITIFFNDAAFETIRKLLRARGLPVFRWLELLGEAIPGTSLAGLFDEFRRHTETELWTDLGELEAFVREPGVIERYIRGEIGFNLLYTFKAMAFTGHLEAMVEAVRRATRALLAEDGAIDPVVATFAEETIRWDACRLTDIIANLEREVSAEFTYDIPRFAADEPPADLAAYALARPAVYRYCLDDEQKDLIHRNLRNFGSDALGIGRLLSVGHTKRMFRTPVEVGARSAA